jgi:histidine ammonia-lyase
VLDALVAALDTGAIPAVHQIGAIGTGDLCALADLALALCGDRPWITGTAPVVTLSSSDALAMISSNAATIGEAVLAQADLDALLRASEVVAALSFVALGGAAEAYGSPVQNARAHPGQLLVATRMRRLLGVGPMSRAGRRLQDPFSLRAVPQVHGTAVDAVERLGTVLDVEINARAENPLLDLATSDAWHNANFHTGYLAHALDSARAAVYPVAELSAARLGDLVDPDFTGLAAFLAEGPPGSSGVMALEYVAQDGVASLRHTTLPATLGSAVISRGLEDHASYSTHGARLATVCVSALRTVLATELVAAVRALEMGAAVPDGLPLSVSLRTAYAQATAVLDPERADRSLSADLASAEDLLGRLGGG